MSAEFEFISKRESYTIFHHAALRELGVSGGEFLRKWHDGDYVNADGSENLSAMRVAMLYPYQLAEPRP